MIFWGSEAFLPKIGNFLTRTRYESGTHAQKHKNTERIIDEAIGAVDSVEKKMSYLIFLVATSISGTARQGVSCGNVVGEAGESAWTDCGKRGRKI